MRGHWHFVALSILVNMLTRMTEHYWFIGVYFIWLLYLFYEERLGKLPLLASLACYLFFSFYIPTIDSPPDPTDVEQPHNEPLTGKIVRSPTIDEKKIEFILQEKVSKDKYSVIFFPHEEASTSDQQKYTELAYGATCKITGNIGKPTESRNPGQFDFSDYLTKQGITHQIIINSLEDVSCRGSSILNHIYTSRVYLNDVVSEKMSPKTAAWLSALVLGNDAKLSEEVIDLFQRWGLSHILAISGLHVGLIVGLAYFLLVKLSLVTKEKAQWLLIIFLPLYAMLAGGQPSVWRASMMALLFIILHKTKLKFSVTDTLSIVFLSMILFDKYIVYHVGFQLSFSVTFGLVISKQLLSSTKSSFYQILQISFISQMMILPLQFVYFSTFQPLSILLNVLVVPYFSLFVIPLMFLLLVFSFIPHALLVIFDTFFTIIHELFLSLLYLIDDVANYPIFIGDFPIVFIVLYYVIFCVFMKNLQSKKQQEAFKSGVLLVGLILCIACRPFFSPVGTVTMLDIGQGDAFVVELPYRKGVFFIDAGATFSFTDFQPSNKVYKQVIQPYLYSRGITKIDGVFLSHEHLDHMGSVPYILADMKIDEIIVSNYYELSDAEETLWKEKKVAVRRLGPSESITLKGQTFQALGLTTDQYSENENSLVLYTELGGKRWLFTGDIGKETERQLIKIYDQLSVDVLKVGHHGSDTSTDPAFIQMIKPEFALVSVGINNSHGHPAAEVIKTLQDAAIEILRTDENGAVQFKFKNKQGTFLRYFP